MARDMWIELVAGASGDADSGGPLFELFHENSKTSRFDRALPTHEIVRHMHELYESLPYDHYPLVALPEHGAATRLSLEEAVLTRHSAPALALLPETERTLRLRDVALLLGHAYGVRATAAGSRRPVASAGALYPLELYFHTTAVDELASGLYHFNAAGGHLRHLRAADLSDEIGEALDQSTLAYDASVIFFITAAFERSTFKYGERGYRFTLLEAGHVAQNMNLAANGLGLGCLSVGGFYDREIDAVLRLDGVTQSTLYMVAIGAELDEAFGG